MREWSCESKKENSDICSSHSNISESWQPAECDINREQPAGDGQTGQNNLNRLTDRKIDRQTDTRHHRHGHGQPGQGRGEQQQSPGRGEHGRAGAAEEAGGGQQVRGCGLGGD